MGKALPQLCSEVEESNPAEHLMFSGLFRWTEASVRGKKSEDLDRIVQLVNSIFQDCEQEIRNAGCFFLRDIDPDDVVGQEIFNALPPELQQQWFALDQCGSLLATHCAAALLGTAQTKA
jgi:hypothetical protein